MKTSNLHSSHWNVVVSWLQPSVNNSKQLKQVQTSTQSRLKPRLVATSKKKVWHSISPGHWIHMVSKLFSTCRDLADSSQKTMVPPEPSWYHELLNKTYGAFKTNNQVWGIDWSPWEVNWQAQLKDWRGASMQAQRFIKHDTAKYEILLVYLHEINYQLKQLDNKIPFKIMNSISRHEHKIEYHWEAWNHCGRGIMN